jgi:D-amino peptidase
MAVYYISADMEGVCGVSSPHQCYPKDNWTAYHAAVQQMADEINWVAQILLESDPSARILVNDAHSTMTNLQPGHLLPQLSLLSGKPKLCAMMTGLTAEAEAAFLIGYHAKAGTERGVLNHTFHNKLANVEINGVSYGEAGINALYASLVHRVPIVLASGDDVFCREITPLVPGIQTVETKIGITTTAAQCHAVDTVKARYIEATRQALKSLPQAKANLPKLEGPYRLVLTFTNSLACDVVMTSPLYTRLDGTRVEVTSPDFQHTYQALQTAYTMLAYTHYMDW